MTNIRKRNVLYILHTAQIGGAAKSFFLFLQQIDTSSFNPIIWVGDDGPFAESFRIKGFKVYVGGIASFENTTHFQVNFSIDSVYMIFRFIINIIPTIIKMVTIIRREKIDLVHINSSTPLLCGFISKLMKVKLIWHVREVFPDNGLKNIQTRIIQYCSDAIIAISERVKKDFTKNQKIHVIYNPIDIAFHDKQFDSFAIKKEMNINPDVKIVGIVGQVLRVRGHFILLEAARTVINKKDDVIFIVVGESPRGEKSKLKKIMKDLLIFICHKDFMKDDERLRVLINKYQLEKQFIMLGYRREVDRLISIMDIVVCPNIAEEAFGRVMYEAGSQRKAIITSNLESFLETINDCVNGKLVEPNNPRELADAIIQILSDDKNAQLMGENLFRIVKERCEKKGQAISIMQLYNGFAY